MADPWPWPADTVIDRARLVAQEYRRHLQQHAPELCGQLDRVMTDLGQTWITGKPTGDTIITTNEAADILAITPRGVRAAVARKALVAAGQDSDGYLFHRSDVMHYLASRRVVARRQCSAVPSTADGERVSTPRSTRPTPSRTERSP